MPPPGQLFLELEIRSRGHAEVNAALVATGHRAFPAGPVWFEGAREQVAGVRGLLEAHGVHGVELEVREDLGPRSELSLAAELRIFGALERRLRAGDVRRVTFCSTSRRRLSWIARLARACPRVEVYAVLHETAYTLGLGEGGVLRRLAARWLYRDLPGNLTWLTLGPWVAEATVERYPFARRSVAWMWHPYLYSPPGTPRLDVGAEPVVFASFGVAKRMKGSHHFLRLARRMTERYGRDRVRFEILGRIVPGSLEIPPDSPVVHAGAGGELERGEIEAHARRADWAVFPYDGESYRYRSSGAIHDAIACGVPILGYAAPPLAPYFESFGDLGELFDSYEALEAGVARAIETPRPAKREHHREAMRRAVSELDPEGLAPAFARPARPDGGGGAPRPVDHTG